MYILKDTTPTVAILQTHDDDSEYLQRVASRCEIFYSREKQVFLLQLQGFCYSDWSNVCSHEHPFSASFYLPWYHTLMRSNVCVFLVEFSIRLFSAICTQASFWCLRICMGFEVAIRVSLNTLLATTTHGRQCFHFPSLFQPEIGTCCYQVECVNGITLYHCETTCQTVCNVLTMGVWG